MTYEQLFIAIDEAAPQLPGCALRVLLHLIAIGIKTGSNEIHLGIRQLAKELGMTKDAVTVATMALKDCVTTTVAPGVTCKFTLPQEWFAQQRSLFAISSPVENIFNRPGNQDTTVLETRTLLSLKPGHQRPGNQDSWANYQDGVSRKPGQLGELPGHSVPKTRTPDTENQQLTDSLLDRSNRVLSSVDRSLHLRDSIEGVNILPEVVRQDAGQLKMWLRSFFAENHPSHQAPDGPDEVLLAKCLAIAPLSRLMGVMEKLQAKRTRPGDSWAWFVTVFCQRIHRERDPRVVRALPGFHVEKKTPSTESGAMFSAGLLQKTAAGVRPMV